MTEEQKTEEGKKMFSIFAARMFEQRVLEAYEAYRERAAEERQHELIRELEDEDKISKERMAKKQSQTVADPEDEKGQEAVSSCALCSCARIGRLL